MSYFILILFCVYLFILILTYKYYVNEMLF